jgi:hypothetical protein
MSQSIRHQDKSKVLFLTAQYFCKFSCLRYIPTEIWEIQDMSRYKSAWKLHLSNTTTIFKEMDYPSLMAIFTRWQFPLTLVLVSSHWRLCLAVMCLWSFLNFTEPPHWWWQTDSLLPTFSGLQKFPNVPVPRDIENYSQVSSMEKCLVNNAIPYT